MRLLKVRTWSVIGVLAMLQASPAIAKAKLDRQIEQTVATGAGGSVEVIVHPKAGYTDSVCGALDRRGQLRARHQLIGSCTAEVTIADLALLANDAAVDSISSNARVQAHQIAVAPNQVAVAPTTTLNVTRATLGIHAGHIYRTRGWCRDHRFGHRKHIGLRSPHQRFLRLPEPVQDGRAC